MRISDIDKNFTVQSLNGLDVVFQAVNQPPFVLEGLPFKDTVCDGAPYCRVSDEDMAAIVPEHECPGTAKPDESLHYYLRHHLHQCRCANNDNDGNPQPRVEIETHDCYQYDGDEEYQ